MTRGLAGSLFGIGSLVAIALGSCGGGDDAAPAPDILWLAPKDTDFNVHLVDEKPFPF
jgi:hypothetical protein